MSVADLDHRPIKKRRFFVDDEEVDTPNVTSPPSSSKPSSSASLSRSSGDVKKDATVSDFMEANPSMAEASSQGFDVETFTAFIGKAVPQHDMRKIRMVAGDDMQRAINIYLDGSWKNSIAQTEAPSPSIAPVGSVSASDNVLPRTTSIKKGQSNGTKSIQVSESIPAVSPKMVPRERYIGAFGVAAWSTKSGVGLVKHNEKIRIERSRIAPKTKLGRGGKLVSVPSRSQKSDVVTRFLNDQGNEVGRLPEETAKWVSTLLDQKVCRFDGVCVYAPERLRVNETVYLQLRCYVLQSAFDNKAFLPSDDDNRATGLFEEKESQEEKNLRLKQVALVKLFDEIHLHPTTMNEMTTRHKKEGILRAAEMVEQIDKDEPQRAADGQEAFSPVEEVTEGQQLEEDQLNTLYQRAQSFDFNMPEQEPADTFALNLRKYQKQALYWMISKEQDTESLRQCSMHPLWEEYQLPGRDADDQEISLADGQDKFYVNPYSGEMSLKFPVQDQKCFGGILADEMGLGKTIEMFSLIHSHQSPMAKERSSDLSPKNSLQRLPRLSQTSTAVESAPCTTLVVAPMSLLAQWESEAAKASKAGTMKSLVYYGNEKSINLQSLCCGADAASAPRVIITSYGTVLSEFNQVVAIGGSRGSHGGLFSVEFFRVILDEAHNIRNRQSKTAKACYEIQATYRWVLTGTPIVNRLEDLFSLVRFLRVEPWSNFSFWKTFITVPFEQKEIARAINVVQTVLEPLVLRRTKDMKTPDGEALVPLPPRKVVIEEIELSNPEREVYDFVFLRAKRAFNASVEAGTLMKSYTTIFAQILRLRQSCCHPVLTRNQAIVADEEDAAIAAAAKDANGLSDDMDLQELIDRFKTSTTQAEAEISPIQESSVNFSRHALQQIQTESNGECPICAEEPMVEPAVTVCWHSACKKCLEDYIAHQVNKGDKPRCFSCREEINPRDVFEVVRHRMNHPDDTETPSVAGSPSPYSSKDNHGNSPAADNNVTTSKPKISLRRIRPLSPTASTSAKIAALIKHLSFQPRNTKSVVFSQFTSFLDLIGPQLSRNSFNHLRFDGTMSQRQRAQVLRSFSAEDVHTPKVLLLSLRAGGVGLNLTAASRVYMMDPWWSFAVEAQAIDRVHRMGQAQAVEVVRFIVRDSIEGRMLRVQDRKMAVAGSLGVGHSHGDEESADGEDEKKRRRIEELEMLLG